MCIRDRPWSAAAFALACRAFIDCVAEDGLHWARQDNDRDGCARDGCARMDEWRKHVQWQGDRIRTLEAQLTSPADERDARRRELELERRRTRALEERLQATQTAHAEVHRRSEEAERPPAGPTGSRRRSISPRTRPHCSGRRTVARSPRSNPPPGHCADAGGTGPRRRPAWPARRSRPCQKRPQAISYLTWTSGRFWIAGRSNDTVAGLAEPVRALADGPARGTPDPGLGRGQPQRAGRWGRCRRVAVRRDVFTP